MLRVYGCSEVIKLVTDTTTYNITDKNSNKDDDDDDDDSNEIHCVHIAYIESVSVSRKYASFWFNALCARSALWFSRFMCVYYVNCVKHRISYKNSRAYSYSKIWWFGCSLIVFFSERIITSSKSADDKEEVEYRQ